MRYLLILILSSCSFIDDEHEYTDERVSVYVERFYQEAKDRGINPPKAVVVIGSVKGWGVSSMDPFPKVTIDRTVIGNPDQKFIEYVIFHELGHAVLKRDHCDGFSIMTASPESAFNLWIKGEQREELLDELFIRKR